MYTIIIFGTPYGHCEKRIIPDWHQTMTHSLTGHNPLISFFSDENLVKNYHKIKGFFSSKLFVANNWSDFFFQIFCQAQPKPQLAKLG